MLGDYSVKFGVPDIVGSARHGSFELVGLVGAESGKVPSLYRRDDYDHTVQIENCVLSVQFFLPFGYTWASVHVPEKNVVSSPALHMLEHFGHFSACFLCVIISSHTRILAF